MIWPFSKPSRAKQMSKAYCIFTEFGPMLRIPRDERLAEAFPNVDAITREHWLQDFEMVEKKIWEFAAQGGPKAYSRSYFVELFLQLFPWMENQALGTAYSRMTYYAIHDGHV